MTWVVLGLLVYVAALHIRIQGLHIEIEVHSEAVATAVGGLGREIDDYRQRESRELDDRLLVAIEAIHKKTPGV